jgi:hypothetical protein
MWFPVNPRFWDTFIFGSQADLDMLECRLTELDKNCYRFVISESGLDPHGRPKPRWLRENWERYAPWHDRIIYVDATGAMTGVPPDPGVSGTYWPYEDAQRTAIGQGLAGLGPDDILGHGDVDEIPKPAAFRLDMSEPWVLGAQHHAYALEWLCEDGWRSYTVMRAAQAPADVLKCRHAMNHLGRAGRIADDTMWHLSWFGGIEAQVAKFPVTVHAMDIPREVAEAAASGRLVRDGWHWQGEWRKLKPYKGTDFPRWVREGNEPACWHKTGATVSAGASKPSVP